MVGNGKAVPDCPELSFLLQSNSIVTLMANKIR